MKYPLDPKDVQFAFITASTLVHTGPCLLVSVHVTQESTQRYVRIHNGTSTSGEPVLDVQGGSKQTQPVEPVPALYLSQGIYAYVEGSIKSATIRYVPLEQSE